MPDGESTQEQQQQTKTEPWGPAKPLLTGLLGKLEGVSPDLTGTERGAFDALSASAQAGNPYASSISGLATDLLGGGPNRTGMVNDAYSTLQGNLNPTASGTYADPSTNAWFQNYLSTVGNDVTNRLGSMYAAAGRDPSGAGNFGQNVGRGVAEGTAPTALALYNSERDRQLGASRSLYDAGVGSAGVLAGLDQQSFDNRFKGAGVSELALNAQNYTPQQLLEIEAQKRGIPLSILGALTGMGTKIAGLGGQSEGTATTTSDMSDIDAFYKVAMGLGGLFGGGQKGGGYV